MNVLVSHIRVKWIARWTTANRHYTTPSFDSGLNFIKIW